MTNDDVLRMARDAGIADGIELPREITAIEIFFEMVSAAEREACANICDLQMEISEINKYIAIGAGNCADAIRARGQG